MYIPLILRATYLASLGPVVVVATSAGALRCIGDGPDDPQAPILRQWTFKYRKACLFNYQLGHCPNEAGSGVSKVRVPTKPPNY